MRNGSYVWYCKRTSKDGDRILTFAKPEKMQLRFGYLTIQPAGGYLDVVEFGENVSRTWNAIGQPYAYWFNKIKEGDRFYLDGVEPTKTEPEDGWGQDANAEVISVRPQNIALRFILQKIE